MLASAVTELAARDEQHLLDALQRRVDGRGAVVVELAHLYAERLELLRLRRGAHARDDLGGGHLLHEVREDETAEVASGSGDENHGEELRVKRAGTPAVAFSTAVAYWRQVPTFW